MMIRTSAACLAWLALLVVLFTSPVSAQPPQLPLDQEVTCAPQTGSFLLGVGVNTDCGFTSGVAFGPRFIPRQESPEYVRCRRELTDCLLLGVHPAAGLLRTRLHVDFDEDDSLPVCTLCGRHFPAGAIVCGVARTAAGGLHQTITKFGRACFITCLNGAAEEAGEPGLAAYERLVVPPVEVEEIPLPAAIERILVPPAEEEQEYLLPFVSPDIIVHVPDGGTVFMAGRRFVNGVIVAEPVQQVEAREPPRMQRRLVRARRWLAVAEAHFLAGEHAQAGAWYRRIQQTVPGTPVARKAEDRLQQLAARATLEELSDRTGPVNEAAALIPPPELIPAPRLEEAAELLPFFIDRYFKDTPLSGKPEAATPERIPEPKDETDDEFTRLLQEVQSVRVRFTERFPVELLPMPSLVPLAVKPVRAVAIEEVLSEQIRQLVTPRLIVTPETSRGEEQADKVLYFDQVLGVEARKGCWVVRPGSGICLDVDCSRNTVRARAQIQVGCLTLRLVCADRRGEFSVSLVSPMADDPHAAQLEHNERILRWIEVMTAAGEEMCEPPG